MALPSSGAISLSQIRAEFGGAAPDSLSEYYKGGAYVTAGDAAPNVPASGAISLSNFYGAAKNVVGQIEYTTPGTYTFVVPFGVTSVCAVCIGGPGVRGGGSYPNSGGGALAYGNNLAVTPGESITVVVGAAGQASYFKTSAYLQGGGGTNGTGGVSSGTARTGGGNGGNGGNSGTEGGGGGAGGYSGQGGQGGRNNANDPGAGSGGGGGGGNGGQSGEGYTGGGGGGGVGLLGQGANGAAGTGSNPAGGGKGGSNGADATQSPGGGNGNYGGGRGSSGFGFGGDTGANTTGAVRIIWGAGRAFPSTNTGNL